MENQNGIRASTIVDSRWAITTQRGALATAASASALRNFRSVPESMLAVASSRINICGRQPARARQRQ